jgi:hypothetical protein
MLRLHKVIVDGDINIKKSWVDDLEIECGLIIGKLVIEETSISRLVLSVTSTGISLKRALVGNGPFIRHSGIVGSLLIDGTVFRREPVIKNIVVDGKRNMYKG